MKSVEVKGAVRTELGKTEAKRLRKLEEIPCVLYGTETPVHFSTPVASFKQLVYTPDALLVKISVGGKNYDAILQDTQFHPLNDEIIHADFLKIEQDKPVTIEIPVKTTGNSKGVLAGGKLQVNLRKIKVKALPANLPDSINIDITNIDLGGTFKVKNLELTKGIEVLSAQNTVIAAVKTTRTSRAAEATK